MPVPPGTTVRSTPEQVLVVGGPRGDGVIDVFVHHSAIDVHSTLFGETGNPPPDYSQYRRVRIAAHGDESSIRLRSSVGQTILINGSSGEINVGGSGQAGQIGVTNARGASTIELEGEEATVALGQAIRLSGNIGSIQLGGGGQHGRIHIRDNHDNVTITIDGATGDIQFAGADCAEEFTLSAGEVSEPGTVMVLNEDGSILRSNSSYDTKVVGVVSGAGGVPAGYCTR